MAVLFLAVLLISAVSVASYDYVVVGGGVAGSVVATRLAAKHSVLLLNIAGPPPAKYNGPMLLTDELIVQHNLTATAGMRAHIYQPGYAPMPNFSTSETGSSPARFLGGSSTVGLSLFLYNKELDWAPGWDWEIMQNYMLKSLIQPTHHPAYLHPLTKAFLNANPAAKPTPVSQRPDGTKITAHAAYIKGLAPERLTIMDNVRADRLVIEGDVCRGVVVRDLVRGGNRFIAAGREVIISAGYAYTPRLLFLSGLGDARDLAAAGLEVVRDLPAVGKNLTAPRFTPVSWRSSEPTLSQMMGPPISRGPSTKAAFQSVVAEATVELGRDAIAQFMPLYYAPRSAPLQYSFQGEPWPLTTNAYTMLITMRTAAQGSIRISRDPDVSPRIVHEPLTPEDSARGAAAVREAVRLASALPSEGRVEHPQYWSAVYDGRGSCRMGADPRSSVVDSSLRVHGLSNLRVVDGSVIPKDTPYLAMPEVLMLAERAADLITDVATFPVSSVPVGAPLLSQVDDPNLPTSNVAVHAQSVFESGSIAPFALLALGTSMCLAMVFRVVRSARTTEDDSSHYVQA